FEGKYRRFNLNVGYFLTFLYYVLSNTFAIGNSLYLAHAK
ncbi:MAG: hypothetical protein ACI8SZ_001691, partial [Colwellia sp.]